MQTHSLPYKNRRRAKSLRKSALLRPTTILPTAASIDANSTTTNNTNTTSSSSKPIPPSFLNPTGASPACRPASDDDVLINRSTTIPRSHRSLSRPRYNTSSSSSSSSHNVPSDTVFWGWIVLCITWIVFVVGMGSVLGVWEWALDGGSGISHDVSLVPSHAAGSSSLSSRREYDYDDEDEDELPIKGYYPALVILTGVMAWVWVLIAWVGMKYFRHSKD